MSGRIFFTLIFFGFFVLIDYYSFAAFRTAFGDKPALRWGWWIFHGLIYLSVLGMILAIITLSTPRIWVYWYFSFLLILYIPKALICSFLFAEDISRVFRWAWQSLFPPAVSPEGTAVRITRSQFLSQSALLAATVPFGGLVYGMLHGKYQYTVRKVTVRFPNLPAAFDGTTITQISDIHAGTFDNKASVKKGIDLINAQGSDYICFTGDLVNNHVEEMDDYRDIFATLTASGGVFSVLGNHDYGEYAPYPTQELADTHRERMLAMHKALGWDLLLNEHRILEKNGEQIALVGIENWGTSFSRYGRLNKAVEGTEAFPFKILLSHDPTHWDAQVRPDYPDIDLTLSGHTHGLQMGVEIPGFRWSPAQWRYRQWAGLYGENGQYIYVNRGFGFLGYSGRVGIWPEITVIRLERA